MTVGSIRGMERRPAFAMTALEAREARMKRNAGLSFVFAAVTVLALLVDLAAGGAGGTGGAGRVGGAPAGSIDVGGGLRAEQRDPLFRRIVVEMLEQGIVGLSAGFIVDGAVVEIAHFGWESREDRIRTSDRTMYRWASMSESLAAVAAMQLAAAGVLDLDAPVRRYVPEFPAKRWPITARQLLAHQGGLPRLRFEDAIDERSGDRRGVGNPLESLDRFRDEPLAYEPGTRSAVSTPGYVLLGAVVQRAGGEPFVDQVRERIAGPLGMTTLRPDDPALEIPHRPVSYERQENGEIVVSDRVDVSASLPGGGYISGIEDPARFVSGLLSDRLVTAGTRAVMWTALPTVDGAATSSGLGFRIEPGGVTRIAQGGSAPGARTFLLINVPARTAIVLMCNTGGVRLGPLANDLLDGLPARPPGDRAP